MGKVSNCITMASLLSNGKKYTVDELAERLEVTPRMVRFYKEELEKSGIYIDTVRGPYGGYVLNQTIRIPGRKFNKNDVELLSSIEKEVSQDLREKIIILKDKVRGLYFGSKEENRELGLDNEVLSKYNLLNRSIKEKRKVKIKYYSHNKGERERIVHPLDMFLFESGWGCVAFCEDKNDLRHFELSRIREYKLLDEKY